MIGEIPARIFPDVSRLMESDGPLKWNGSPADAPVLLAADFKKEPQLHIK